MTWHNIIEQEEGSDKEPHHWPYLDVTCLKEHNFTNHRSQIIYDSQLNKMYRSYGWESGMIRNGFIAILIPNKILMLKSLHKKYTVHVFITDLALKLCILHS